MKQLCCSAMFLFIYYTFSKNIFLWGYKMKKIIYSFFCLIILVIINIVLSKIFKVEFLEMSFITGLASSVSIGFFSSEGGATTSMLDFKVKHLLESKSRTDSSFIKLHNIPFIPFIVSIIYTILSAIVSIIVYWKYF